MILKIPPVRDSATASLESIHLRVLFLYNQSMNTKRNFLLFAILILAIAAVFYFLKNWLGTDNATATYPPKFEDFKATDIFMGTPAVPDFSTNKDAFQFKTVITNGAKEGPNFAGSYTVVSWGCGTGCQGNAIVDARTGKIVIFGNDYVSTRGLRFEKNSKLIIFDPYDPTIKPDAGMYDFHARYFVFENGKLNEIYREGCVMPADKLECGEIFYGFIRSFSGRTASIDTVEFLSGTEAKEKAALDTGCPVAKAEECVPSLNNDFYIRNTNKTAEPFDIGINVVIKIEADQGSPVLAPFSPSGFESAYANDPRLSNMPFKFIKQGGVIISIEQQYTP